MPVTQERIRLKNLKVADFASEETLCFSATVLFDGKPIAEARNEGFGGPTHLRPLTGAQAALAEAEAYASTLPPYTFNRPGSTGPSSDDALDMSLDFLVDLLAEELHAGRKLRAAFNRDIGNKALFVRDGTLKYLKGVKLKAYPNQSVVFARIREKFGGTIVILNELPTEEAFAVWKQFMADDTNH
ncbi:hypothetical protein DIE11_17560 [Burkholderia sp. Bp9012]|uniref:hypothetical protein n=1 Tax=Burkholderia sp. Bp9012 TaxID=2184562 RepID=UPI000F5928FB|nr:hypothetical protein [Burkholderia sp. Bp9012]RQR79199.1 hypothetical protein DIE11_17560 [Burkholderia sp. Bp9012]